MKNNTTYNIMFAGVVAGLILNKGLLDPIGCITVGIAFIIMSIIELKK